MYQEIDLNIKQEFISDYKKGYPLIVKESVVDWTRVTNEGTIVNLIDAKNRFIVKGYYGVQNKGYGWVLTSKKDENIDADYFIKKKKSALE